jgi:hypothetical protein
MKNHKTRTLVSAEVSAGTAAATHTLNFTINSASYELRRCKKAEQRWFLRSA